MKITVLHGEDNQKSYARLMKFIDVAKSRNWGVSDISENINLGLGEQISTPELFDKKRLFIVRGFKKLHKKDIDWINKNFDKYDTTLIIYESDNVLQTNLKSLPKNINIERYDIPKIIFKFLEAFYPGNSKTAIILFHELIKKEPVEFVFSLLAKYLRDLYWVKTDVGSLNHPLWRIKKLQMQSKKFDNAQLKKIINDFAEADIKNKTSQGELIDSIDFIIVSKLK